MPTKIPGPYAYDAWFRAKVQEALDDQRSITSHARAMEQAQVAIDVANMPGRATSPNLDFQRSTVYTSV